MTIQIDPACMRLCYCIHNMVQCKLYLEPLSPAMSADLQFFCYPAMHKCVDAVEDMMCLCKGSDGCFVFSSYCNAWRC